MFEEYVSEGKVDEGCEVVLESNYRGGIKYEYSVKSHVGGDIDGGGWVGGSG